jgi:DNA modification methylase
MNTNEFEEIPPYNDDSEIEQIEILRINKQQFVELLQLGFESQSTESLRSHFRTVKERLHDPNDSLFQIPEAVENAEFGKPYLIAEIDQILESFSIERAHYYIERLIKSVREVRTNDINDINLNRWKEYEDIYTDSLWQIERRDSSGVHKAGYWGNFIPQIPNQMMRRYTKPGDWVLDTFAGSGTTLIEGQRLGRNTIGIELQERMVEHIRELVRAEPNQHKVKSEVKQGDNLAVDYEALLAEYNIPAVQLVIMHPPYFDIIKFTDDERDYSNAESIEGFVEMMGRLVDRVTPVLEKGRYLVIVIGDKYVKGEWVPLGFQTMNMVMQRGFALKSIIVKNFEDTSAKRSQKELWRYRAFVGGFYIFKHEYIFLFKKR